MWAVKWSVCWGVLVHDFVTPKFSNYLKVAIMLTRLDSYGMNFPTSFNHNLINNFPLVHGS